MSLLPSDTPLRACPQWSTMQWLSLAAMTRIDTATKRLAKSRHASRQDLVGVLVMYCAPEEPTALWGLLDPYLRGNRAAKGKGSHQALMTKLPSPVSLRLDGLVERAREVGTAYRQDLVGALAMKAVPAENRLVELFDAYYAATAGQAALAGTSPHAVLARKAPKPGRRASRR